MEPTSRTRLEPNSHSSDFLLAEFDALQQRVAAFEEIKSTRVNFFLIVVAAFVAGLPTVLDKFPTLLLQLTAISSAVLLLLGAITLDQIVDYSISIVTFHQRAGRIRRWYVDNDQQIAAYVPFSAGDDRPSLVISFPALVFRGADAIVLFINCLTFAVVVLSLLNQRYPLLSWQSLAASLLSLVVGWYLQKFAIRAKLVRADKRRKSEIRFPIDDKLNSPEKSRRGKK